MHGSSWSPTLTFCRNIDSTSLVYDMLERRNILINISHLVRVIYLYALRSMKGSGALSSGSHSILLTCEEILEYAIAFFANSPLFLSDIVEKVQRRALRITL